MPGHKNIPLINLCQEATESASKLGNKLREDPRLRGKKMFPFQWYSQEECSASDQKGGQSGEEQECAGSQEMCL